MNIFRNVIFCLPVYWPWLPSWWQAKCYREWGAFLASPFDVSAMSVPSLFFATLNKIFSISEFILSTIRTGTQQYPGLVPRARWLKIWHRFLVAGMCGRHCSVMAVSKFRERGEWTNRMSLRPTPHNWAPLPTFPIHNGIILPVYPETNSFIRSER